MIYEVISNTNYSNLKEEVDKYLQSGWVLHGGPTFDHFTFYQVIARYKTNAEEEHKASLFQWA